MFEAMELQNFNLKAILLLVSWKSSQLVLNIDVSENPAEKLNKESKHNGTQFT